MSDDLTTGISNPDKPGWWLVPPWRADASFSEVVLHFLRRTPLGNTNTGHLLAYYEGYRAALDAAPADDPTDSGHRRWCAEMRDRVGRCAVIYREMRAAERTRAKGTVSTLRIAARARHHLPARQEKAS